MSAVAAQTGSTIVEAAAPNRSLLIQAGEQRHTFHANFTTGRQGTLAISDEFASSRHARFQIAHGLWYVEDLGSTNGTWLNGRRFRAPQHLKKGDKIRLTGIGIFQVRKRPARMGRNPATGEAIKIKASKKIAFRAAKDLKQAI